jgi:hypothetical protein
MRLRHVGVGGVDGAKIVVDLVVCHRWGGVHPYVDHNTEPDL